MQHVAGEKNVQATCVADVSMQKSAKSSKCAPGATNFARASPGLGPAAQVTWPPSTVGPQNGNIGPPNDTRALKGACAPATTLVTYYTAAERSWLLPKQQKPKLVVSARSAC